MSMTYEDHLHFALPSNDSQSHGLQLRQNWAAVGQALAPTGSYFVSPAFTGAAMFNVSASDRRHFPTVQEAITAAESDNYAHKYTVFIYPGTYYENIIINGNITLAGMVNPIWEGLGGGISAQIVGTNSYAGPTVRINPDGVGYGAVNLINLCLNNVYNVANSVEITEPYLIDITKPATYDKQACVAMKNCLGRMQTQGDHNSWYYGIRAQGFGRLTMENCSMKAWGYAGDENDGGIRRLIYLRGDSANGNNFTFYSKNSNFYSSFLAGTLRLPHIFDIDDGVVGSVGRSGWDMDAYTNLLIKGSTGYNAIGGLEGSTIESFMNTPGLCLSWL